MARKDEEGMREGTAKVGGKEGKRKGRRGERKSSLLKDIYRAKNRMKCLHTNEEGYEDETKD